jgi:hypothetical protein
MGRAKSTGSRVAYLRKGKKPTSFVQNTVCAETFHAVVSPTASEMSSSEDRRRDKRAVW